MDLGALSNASGAETIEDLQSVVDQNHFLHSFVGVIGDVGAVGGFPSSKIIAGSVKLVLDTSQNISVINDLACETDSGIRELTAAYTEILCQFLIVMGTIYSEVKRGRVYRWMQSLLKVPDSIKREVQEFKRMGANLNGLLLTLVFEATHPPNSISLPQIASPTIGHGTSSHNDSHSMDQSRSTSSTEANTVSHPSPMRPKSDLVSLGASSNAGPPAVSSPPDVQSLPQNNGFVGSGQNVPSELDASQNGKLGFLRRFARCFQDFRAMAILLLVVVAGLGLWAARRWSYQTLASDQKYSLSFITFTTPCTSHACSMFVGGLLALGLLFTFRIIRLD
ncbi:hypothetical protein DL96DRAFT_1818123 [Flagelloscypha sp. PMI_526]|nr:hypothetical protein DL96DRAFT_1818123 [Flagelloscypha sp. PMI_526]